MADINAVIERLEGELERYNELSKRSPRDESSAIDQWMEDHPDALFPPGRIKARPTTQRGLGLER